MEKHIQEVNAGFRLQPGMRARPQKQLPYNETGKKLRKWCADNDVTFNRLAFKSGVSNGHLRTVCVGTKPLSNVLAVKLTSYMRTASTEVPELKVGVVVV